MGAHLEIFKTKKTKIVDNKLLIDEAYKLIGQIDCSYSSMNDFCKGENIIELINRQTYNDNLYHLADEDSIRNIEEYISTLSYDKGAEIIIVVYDNA